MCPDYATGMPSRIEGIGRPRIEPSFVPGVIDLMIPVPDAASVAAVRHLHAVTGRWAGGSTGTNLWGVWQLVARMRDEGVRGSIVTLICDGGERYRHSYYDDGWVRRQGMDLAPYTRRWSGSSTTGEWVPSRSDPFGRYVLFPLSATFVRLTAGRVRPLSDVHLPDVWIGERVARPPPGRVTRSATYVTGRHIDD